MEKEYDYGNESTSFSINTTFTFEGPDRVIHYIFGEYEIDVKVGPKNEFLGITEVKQKPKMWDYIVPQSTGPIYTKLDNEDSTAYPSSIFIDINTYEKRS